MTADILHSLAIGIVLPEIRVYLFVIVLAFIWQEHQTLEEVVPLEMFMLFSTCLFFPGLPCFPDSASTDNLFFTNVLFDCHTLPLYLSSPPAPLSEPR